MRWALASFLFSRSCFLASLLSFRVCSGPLSDFGLAITKAGDNSVNDNAVTNIFECIFIIKYVRDLFCCTGKTLLRLHLLVNSIC